MKSNYIQIAVIFTMLLSVYVTENTFIIRNSKIFGNYIRFNITDRFRFIIKNFKILKVKLLLIFQLLRLLLLLKLVHSVYVIF